MTVTSITATRPKKSMTTSEIKLLKALPVHLAGMRSAEVVLAETLRLVASYMDSPSALGFESFAKAWLKQGNAKTDVGRDVLKEVFSVIDDGPEAA